MSSENARFPVEGSTPAAAGQFQQPMSERRLRLATLVVAVGVLFSLQFACLTPAHAQSAASISGTVSDTNGAVIPGVHVTLRNVATSVEQSTQSNGSGAYAFVNVAPGKYSLEFTRNGFASAQETNVVLGVNQAALFNITMVPGSVQQTISVSANSSTQQTTTAALGAVIATKSVTDLPLNGRNFTQMLELTPGVSRVTVAQNATGGQTSNPI